MATQLTLRVVPNARKTACEGLMDDGETLKIRLAAPPVDGKANEALLLWLVETLHLRRSQVRLVAGEKSRNKRVEIEGLERETTLAKLMAASA